jgi:hypothetical protein
MSFFGFNQEFSQQHIPFVAKLKVVNNFGGKFVNLEQHSFTQI